MSTPHSTFEVQGLRESLEYTSRHTTSVPPGVCKECFTVVDPCDTSDRTRSRMDSHMSTCHGLWVCDRDAEQFTSSEAYKKHMLRHDPRLPFRARVPHRAPSDSAASTTASRTRRISFERKTYLSTTRSVPFAEKVKQTVITAKSKPYSRPLKSILKNPVSPIPISDIDIDSLLVELCKATPSPSHRNGYVDLESYSAPPPPPLIPNRPKLPCTAAKFGIPACTQGRSLFHCRSQSGSPLTGRRCWSPSLSDSSSRESTPGPRTPRPSSPLLAFNGPMVGDSKGGVFEGDLTGIAQPSQGNVCSSQIGLGLQWGVPDEDCVMDEA